MKAIEVLGIEMETGDICEVFEQLRVFIDDRHVRAVDGGNFDRFEALLFFAEKDPVIDREGFPILPTAAYQNQRYSL